MVNLDNADRVISIIDKIQLQNLPHEIFAAKKQANETVIFNEVKKRGTKFSIVILSQLGEIYFSAVALTETEDEFEKKFNKHGITFSENISINLVDGTIMIKSKE